MYGGAFPEDSIPLTKFKDSDTRKHFTSLSCTITPVTLKNRIEYLQKYKDELDKSLNKGKSNEKQYTPEFFNEGVLKRIKEENIRMFQRYSPQYSYDQYFEYVHPAFILPILNEYLAAGFTPEELLRAELDDITITAILNEIVPNIDTSSELKNGNQSKSMRAKISVYGYNYAFLVSAGIPDLVLNETVLWTEEHNTLLKQKIRDTILTALIKATISKPAQLINLGFSLEELNAKDIGYDLSKLKDVSIKKLLDAGFLLDELKAKEFTAKDFRDNGYNLKQLIESKFTMENIITDKITFSDDDFLVNGDLDAEVFRQAGFTLENIYNLKLGTSNKPEKGVHPLIFKVNIIKYLKSIGFTAQEFKDSGIFSENVIDYLILAGFNYAEIQIVRPVIENDEIYKALRKIVGPSSVLKEFQNCPNLKFSYEDLKKIGFLPMEISTMNGDNLKKSELPNIKSAGFTVLDFQMEPIENLILIRNKGDGDTFDETQFKSEKVRNVPMEYTKKYFKPLDMNHAGFKLQDLIRTQELIDANKRFTQLGLGYDYRLEYDLKDLMVTYIREFIDPNPPACNIAKIFETGLYTYGEIRQVVEAYEGKGDWYKTNIKIKNAIDRIKDTGSYETNLNSIKKLLTNMKDEIITDNTSKQVPMCERKWGMSGLLGSNGTTDDNCKYKKKPTVPVAAN